MQGRVSKNINVYAELGDIGEKEHKEGAGPKKGFLYRPYQCGIPFRIIPDLTAYHLKIQKNKWVS